MEQAQQLAQQISDLETLSANEPAKSVQIQADDEDDSVTDSSDDANSRANTIQSKRHAESSILSRVWQLVELRFRKAMTTATGQFNEMQARLEGELKAMYIEYQIKFARRKVFAWTTT